MRGSVTAAVVVLCLLAMAAAWVWATREVNRASRQLEAFEGLRGQVPDLEARVAALEAENTAQASQIVFLKDLVTGRKDIQELIAEIRTMVWVLADRRAREGAGVSDPTERGATDPR